MNKSLEIAFFGSSIVSAYWNGAATYYRGIVKALHKMGHHITFYEPDIYQRQEHRDIPDPEWCSVKVYEAREAVLEDLMKQAANADVIIKASGVGAYDQWLEQKVVQLKNEHNLVIFWDVDAPATLERIDNDPQDPFKSVVGQYDLILTYGGGNPVVEAYQQIGAQGCIPIYNGLDTDSHYPVASDPKFNCDLAFLGNRLPDREQRVEEFFIEPARKLPDLEFILGGSGWDDKPLSSNVKYLGHVYTKDHNAFNCTPRAVLNISRDSMARFGFSPATRVFEAAGAGACIITDYWEGIETFFEPGKEILVASSGKEVIQLLEDLSPEKAKEIGRAALGRVLSEHTYAHRASLLEKVFSEKLKGVASVSPKF